MERIALQSRGHGKSGGRRQYHPLSPLTNVLRDEFISYEQQGERVKRFTLLTCCS